MAGKSPSPILRWIFEQLAGSVPDWFKAMFLGQPRATHVLFSKNTETISTKNGLFIAPKSLLKGSGPNIPAVGKRIVDASVPQDFFLKRKIEAPLTAGRNLRQLVELDMVRRTPFRPDTVYWSLSKPKKINGKLLVEQWIAKRSDIERLQQRTARIGLHIRKVFVENSPMQNPIADLSASITPMARRWRLLNGTLAVSAVGLAAVIWFYPILQTSAENDRISESIAQKRTQAIALRREVDDLRSREMERAAFLNIVYQRPRLSHTLRKITVALPDDVWLSDIIFSPEDVIVSGEVRGSAAQLVLTLAQRNEFHNPRLSGPVASARNGAERFELSLDLGRTK